jgi:hypothetical protein
MINEHEAAKYVENNTTLAKDVYVAARGDRTVTLRGINEKPDGTTVEVDIQITDNGPGAHDHRYAVEVYADGEKKIVANPDGTLPLAISNADVHSSGLFGG